MIINREAVFIAMSRKQWQRADLAKEMGISVQAINIMLSGKVRHCYARTAGRLAEALGVDVAEILVKE